MILIADTSPLNYLVQIDAVETLPQLFDRVVIPPGVQQELLDAGAPEEVQKWINNAPDWLEVQSPAKLDESLALGAGETEAISLAVEIAAEQILLDDKAARNAAETRGLPVIGTLGLLSLAAERGLLDFKDALEKLRKTNFRASQTLFDELIKRHKQENTIN